MMGNFCDLVIEMKAATVLVLASTNLKELPEAEEYIKTSDNLIFSKGTGFCVDPKGIVVTANHVIPDNSDEIKIRFASPLEESFTGKIRARDKESDICVLEIEKVPDNLSYLNLGDYKNCHEGEDVGFIGFPLQFNFPLVHKGIISGKTSLTYEKGMKEVPVFTINAFVNRGNSGGPVFHCITGEILGVVNARPNLSSEDMFLKLPPGYSPIIRIGNVDPLSLTVETYNRAIKYIGEVTQIGIGYCSSVELVKNLL